MKKKWNTNREKMRTELTMPAHTVCMGCAARDNNPPGRSIGIAQENAYWFCQACLAGWGLYYGKVIVE
jgi:hypothetical protein